MNEKKEKKTYSLMTQSYDVFLNARRNCYPTPHRAVTIWHGAMLHKALVEKLSKKRGGKRRL
ncbi:MAG: hypothetical protein DIZ80_09260 [endosymbiont of Galathealinum brachiosum]|uniref:Uncharacterized protein n=1 Tax=endosymbiont of Galathealinum brachiosum TaxID=2200906 RepID=A0A370DC37_9GAMM|nr:MAG: hypothetical protein DIZ80_09260 [endosymbiont of Galathealinum brachiosum]